MRRSIFTLAVFGLVLATTSSGAGSPEEAITSRFAELGERVAVAALPSGGNRTSLLQKLAGALAAYQRGQPCTALHVLDAYAQETRALGAADLRSRGLLLAHDLIATLPEGQCRARDAYRCEAAPWPELAPRDLRADPPIATIDGAVSLTAGVENRGGSAAQAVVVRFEIDGAEVAREVVAEVPACGRAAVDATWVASSIGAHRVVVIVDPDGALTEGTELDNRAEAELLVAFELTRPWERPDLGIRDLRIDPARPPAGASIALSVTVANVSDRTRVSGAIVRFLVDGAEVDRRAVPDLDPRATAGVAGTWAGAIPGRHQVAAEVDAPRGAGERETGDNAVSAVIDVGGVDPPVADLVVEDLAIETHSPAELVATVRNIGWAASDDILVLYSADGADFGDEVLPGLAPGEARVLRAPLPDFEGGEHVVALHLDPDEISSAVIAARTFSVGYVLGLLCRLGDESWESLGPSKLSNGSVGRADAIAIDPSNTAVMYAATPRGGIWKTANGGAGWTPRTDGLPSLIIHSITLDPGDPAVVYAGSAAGIYKSRDAGASWKVFSGTAIGNHFRDLIVRSTGSGVEIHAGTNTGVWRLDDAPRYADEVADSAWTRIHTGIVHDLVQSSTDPTRLIAAIEDPATHQQRVYRTKPGGPAAGDASWDPIMTGLPTNAFSTRVAMSRSMPDVVYASILVPQGWVGDVFYPPRWQLFRSPNGGTGWALRHQTIALQGWFGYWENFYNAYVEVDPAAPDTAYVGHIQPWRWDDDSSTLTRLSGAHDDQHGIGFLPTDHTTIFLLGDGGVFRGTGRGAAITPLNDDLRVTMFFDVTLSAGGKMAGGTQDNGTISTDGSPVWTEIRGNDGRYTVFDPTSSDVIYAQEQYLDSTAKGVRKGAGWEWRGAPGLPVEDHPFFIVRPGNPQVLYAAGATQIYQHTNAQGDWSGCPKTSCTSWTAIGPTGANGWTRRVAVDATNDILYAGMTSGEIWERRGSQPWAKIYTHPTGKPVTTLVVGSGFFTHRLYASFEGTGVVDGPNRLRLLEWSVTSDTGSGVSWTSSAIAGDLPVERALGRGWEQSNMIALDPYRVDVLYVATDLGVYQGARVVSGGAAKWVWSELGCGMPNVAITDLELHPTTWNLYAATYGRGLWRIPILGIIE